MRYFVTGEQNRQVLMNTIVLLFLAYVALLWVSNALMFFHKMGLNPQSVIDYYLGSEAKFTQPISYQSLLENTHFHLFAMGMLAVTLTHLLLFTPLNMQLKVLLTSATYLAAIADQAGGWLVRFVHPQFAWFKIGAFLLLEASLLALLVFTVLSLYYQRKQQTARLQNSNDAPAFNSTPVVEP